MTLCAILNDLVFKELGFSNSVLNFEQKFSVLEKKIEKLVELLELRDQEIASLKFKNSQLEQLVTSIGYQLNLFKKDSKLYQKYNKEDLQDCMQRFHFQERIPTPFVHKVSYKYKNLVYNLKKFFLENRKKRSMKYSEAKEFSHMNFRTIKKAFETLVQIIPGAFKILKINSKEKALCLINEELFLNYRVH